MTDFEVSGVGTTTSCPIGVIDRDVEPLRGGGVGKAFGTMEVGSPAACPFNGRGENGGVDTSCLGDLLLDSLALGVDPLFSSSLSLPDNSPLFGVLCACPPLRGVVLPKVDVRANPRAKDGMTMSSKFDIGASIDRRELRVRLSLRLSFKGLSLRCAFVLFRKVLGLGVDAVDS